MNVSDCLSASFLFPPTDHKFESLSPELKSLLKSRTDLRFEEFSTRSPYASLCDPRTTPKEKRRRIRSSLQEALASSNKEGITWLMLLGSSSLLSFIELNFVGPEAKRDSDEREWIAELAVDGEDFPTKTVSPHLLLLSRMLLLEPLQLDTPRESTEGSFSLQMGDVTVELEPSKEADLLSYVSHHLPSWLLWAGRTAFVHQKLLRHSSATLRRESVAVAEAMEEQLRKEAIGSAVGGWIYLEMAQWEILYRRMQRAREYVDRAESMIGISVELSGAMGKRTVHQVDPKAQLIVKVTRHNESIQKTSEKSCTSAPGETGETERPKEEDDVLLQPKWVEEISVGQLDALEQCLMLTKCDIVELGTADDALKPWEMEPYVQLVGSQTSSTFLIQIKAKLVRIQHERLRGRTKDRALTMMEQLVHDIRFDPSIDRHGIQHLFSLRLPSILQLRKQLAEQQIAFGDAASAMQTYEELELWDELVTCYRLLAKKALADVIVCRQLDNRPDDPRLLCVLGDLRSDPEYYRRAWEASNRRYPRAQRSLGRCALEKKDYGSAVGSFDLALELNTLHPDVWFSLGYCHLKLKDDVQALKAFTRCAQLEPENGEAWNNLGVLWMRKKKPDRALWALKEATKYKRSSWETWDNYATAALECKEYHLAIQATVKVLELTDGHQPKSEAMTELIEGCLDRLDHDRSEAAGKLSQRLEALLRKACLSPVWKAEHWLLFAKLQKHLKAPLLVQDCLMKASRQLYGSGWKNEISLFSLLIEVLSELVHHYRHHSVTTSDVKGIQLQLKGIIKQAEGVYGDSEGMKKLRAIQEEADRLEMT